MAKPNRGRSLWKSPSRSRGTCPVCLSTRIKLLYSHKTADGTKITVCKRCDKASEARLSKAITNEVAAKLPFRNVKAKSFNKQKKELVSV